MRSAKCDLRDEQMAEQRDGEAQGRVDWKRNGGPDAKSEEALFGAGGMAWCFLSNSN